ncbi:hypothetical protein EFW28_24700, partial [Salmonella enterica subsp. enterica serovar Schwarzengrund]|nr:hypothetical protein [Salmonella enterica subsp. enterica serovar Schwarzengrund]EEW1599444.1 hypothetical protein [Escherichia coli]EBZ7382136.1 hypothetical protein [Salmonella enterica subsp. enterica serovar Schwarzengrund]ECA9541442.1 hypothetical protein [Salmonella enterica subsp. enterica serovar Schwarzengrund]ECU2763295.1 hypothetical protein [Salmonella enterica subsp. enterica serovar Schwarzengrund]
LQQTLNTVDLFAIPRISQRPQNLNKFRKTVLWIPLCHHLQHDNNGFVTLGIRTIMVNYSDSGFGRPDEY